MTTTTTDLNNLIAARDHVQGVTLEDAQAAGWRDAATHLLDMVIMDMCPHDPATDTVEPLDGVLEGRDHVTCPVCRASVIMKDTRSILVTAGCFQVEQGDDRRIVLRHLCLDQDIDGSWCVWSDRAGWGDDEDRPPEGSVSIFDPAVTAFLEQLHALISDPVSFGHAPDIGKREAA